MISINFLGLTELSIIRALVTFVPNEVTFAADGTGLVIIDLARAQVVPSAVGSHIRYVVDHPITPANFRSR